MFSWHTAGLSVRIDAAVLGDSSPRAIKHP